MRDWPVFRTLQDRLSLFVRMLPVTRDLKNTSLRERHWNQLVEIVGRQIRPDDGSIVGKYCVVCAALHTHTPLQIHFV